MDTINVGVYDDNAIFAHGVLSVLREDPLVGEVSVELADAPSMNVAVTSIGMVGSEGIRCPIVACVSTREVPPPAIHDAGVVALLNRDNLSPDQLCVAVHAAAAGLRIHWDSAPSTNVLDERSRAVLKLLASGAGTREISVALGYSERTIKGTIQQLQRTLGARSRAHAVAVALRSALI